MYFFHSILWALTLVGVEATQQACSSINPTDLKSYNATIINSTFYAVGKKSQSGVTNNVAFCEVFSKVNYGPGDTLYFATWLPEQENYASRFMAVGNGGFGGSIDYDQMMTQLNSGNGLAVAGGDAGHFSLTTTGISNTPIPFLHDDLQTEAWIHDAISIFTGASRSITKAYYNQQPKYSYFWGCSTGGAQGFALAQRHPDLFDGVYAGSPGNWYSHLALSFLWNAQHTNTPLTYLSQDKLNLIYNAVLNQCDALDGVKDGIIENPLKCNFNIDSLACKGTKILNCLTKSQLGAIKSIYAGPVRSDNGKQIYPGFTQGAENQLLLQEGIVSNTFSVPLLQNRVFDSLLYNANTFNYASDVDKTDQNAGAFIDSISPDLRKFNSYGHKLLVSQGWSDPLNAPTWPIQQLGQINSVSGANQNFLRLFMVPGGGHCGAALFNDNVPASYAVVPALIKWVENKQVPSQIQSYDPPDGSNTTRKLCAWPSTAKYRGGDVNNWNSYVCTSQS